MPIGTSDGNVYEDDMHHALDIPMFPQSTEELKKSPGYNPAEDTYTAHIFRHGDIDLETNHGWSPAPLNEEGQKHAEKAANTASSLPLHALYTSDLPRTVQTSDAIANKTAMQPIPTEALRTWDLGAYTGKTDEASKEAVKRLCSTALNETPPSGNGYSGESFNDFKNRIIGAVGGILSQHPNQEIGLVTHNSVEKVLRAWDASGQLPNGKLDMNEFAKDKIQPGGHKEFNLEHPDVFQQSFGSTAAQAQQETDPLRRAAQIARAGVTSLAGKAAGMVTGPIEAMGRIAERYTRAIQIARGEKVEPNEELDDQTSHVLDMMSVLGASGSLVSAPESSLAANRIKIIPSGASEEGQISSYKIMRNTPEGEKEIGYVNPSYQAWDKSVHINMIRTSEKSTLERKNVARKLNAHAHALTSSEIRDLFRELVREYPEAVSVQGWRISGAHSNQARALQEGRSAFGFLSSVSPTRGFNDSIQKIPIPQSLRDWAARQKIGEGPLERSLGQLARAAPREKLVEKTPESYRDISPATTNFLQEGFQDMLERLRNDPRSETNQQVSLEQEPFVPREEPRQQNYRSIEAANELTRDYATEVRRAHPNADVRTEQQWEQAGPTQNPFTNVNEASRGNRHAILVYPEYWNMDVQANVQHSYNGYSVIHEGSRRGRNWLGEAVPGGIHDVPGTRLTSQGSKEITALIAEGKSQREIAKELGVSSSKVQRMLDALEIKSTGKSKTRFGSENANPRNEVFYRDRTTGRVRSPQIQKPKIIPE